LKYKLQGDVFSQLTSMGLKLEEEVLTERTTDALVEGMERR
jgi:hypothetical protein